MAIEIGYLQSLVDRDVVEVGTDISTTIPLMDKNPDNILIEIPLRISFDLYTLFIYNRWKYISEVSTRVEDIKGQKLTSLEIIGQTLELRFNSADVIQIDMSDDGYVGPEALVLHEPNDLTVVWN